MTQQVGTPENMGLSEVIQTSLVSWHNYASLVPLGSGPASVLEMGDVFCVWLWLVVFGCVSMCCLRCVVGCVSVGVDALAVVWW